jgi:integrase
MATISQLPSGRWQAKVRRKGFPARSITKRTKAAAERWARQQEAELDKQTPGQEPGDTAVSVLFDRYRQDRMDKKKGASQEGYRMTILARELGTLQVRELDDAAVIQYAERRLEVVSSDTVKRELMQLSGIVRRAATVWKYPLNPKAVGAAIEYLEDNQMFRPKVHRDRRLRPGEYKRLLKASNPRMRVIIRLIIETGLRRSEVVKLRPEHLTDRGLWVLDDKTGKSTLIPVSQRARRIIEGLDKDGVGGRADSITQAFERAVKRAGLVDLRVHDLRHEAVSRLFEKGLAVQEVAMISRHSDWRSLKIYTQPSVEKVGEKLG